ncbi:hypothetical protein KVQ01_11450 [Escherichia coli]|uniref:hypothetical protein n=1 Tax=Escherichia coli TaxID=562 RepID=UPI001F064A16|nr:hypothetical protein [Escherichia coli]MCH0685635.1 hypothetical protein [Escherichia coli]MDZ8664462.1 hypothetical protein [Escherichia coli]WRX87718.1 hypothetical protein SM938_22590 [Escherichia coli]
MSSPLYGADYLRPPKRSGTKEEVLAGLFEHLDKTLGKPCAIESKEARMARKMDELWANRVWQDNYEASFCPGWQVVGPVKSEYIDDRMRTYRGRYGHVRSD